MEINKVIQHMVNDLDFIIVLWDLLRDEESRNEMQTDFRHAVKAYNYLLGKVYNRYDIRFPDRVDRYLARRETYKNIR